MLARVKTPILVLLFACLCLPLPGEPAPIPQETDMVVVGAGISGLCAALESARHGARVTVIDMASVFGGADDANHATGPPNNKRITLPTRRSWRTKTFCAWAKMPTPHGQNSTPGIRGMKFMIGCKTWASAGGSYFPKSSRGTVCGASMSPGAAASAW